MKIKNPKKNLKWNIKQMKREKLKKQAGAELCQAQLS